MRGAFLALLAILAVTFGWRRRGLVKSVGVRRLAAALPNPAKRHGLQITIPADRAGWIRVTLQADLGPALSGVVGYPLQAAAYSHFGGFNLSRVYSDFMNPESDYYQAWVGAYVVFDSEERQHFGFDGEGQAVMQEALDVLEADQRLVLGGAGCPNWFPDGRRVRLIGEMAAAELGSGGERWWRLDGRAETWSAYHRGSAPGGERRAEVVYGRVPDGASHPVDDFHPLTYSGSFWLRYYPEWRATCAKFYIYPEYTDARGRPVTKGRLLESECRALVEGIAFAKAALAPAA